MHDFNRPPQSGRMEIFMKKASVSRISLILVLAMLLSLLAACSPGNTTGETDSQKGTESTEASQTSGIESETEDIFFPEIESNNYGEDFVIAIMPDVNLTEYHWVEESSGDVLSEAIYHRQAQVYDYLGVDVVAKELEDYLSYTEPFKAAIRNKDDSIQMIITHVHSGVSGLVEGNYLRDFNDIPEINLEAEYWNQAFMEELSMNNKMYLGNNRFNILRTYVLSYNKTMMEQYEDSMETSVYDLVREKRWTLDQMINLTKKVYIDKTADGKTVDDTFGFTGVQWVPFCGFLQASDIKLIEMNDKGDYTLAFYNDLNKERTATLITKLSDLANSDCSWLKYRVEPTPEITLGTGRALMTMIGTDYLNGLCAVEDLVFGVLPYPMFDEAQAESGYHHLQWGGFTGIPTYTANPTMVGETVELLAYYSADVNIAFYEKMLGKQVADVPDDREMLDLVWDTICSDMGQAYSDVGVSVLYMVPELTHEATLQLASYASKNERTITKAFEKFLERLKKRG